MLLAIIGGEHPEGSMAEVPTTVDVIFFGSEGQLPIVASLEQHSYNLAWIGILVTAAAFWVWRANKLAALTCIVLGGLADLGYFIFVDLPGLADPPGPQMTWIMALAIILCTYAYFASRKFTELSK
jgi:hypothetical protein